MKTVEVTDKKENNTYWQRVKKAIDVKLVGLVVLIIWQVGEGFWHNYQAGAEAAKYDEFKLAAKKLIKEETALPNLMTEIFNSQFVQDFAGAKQKEVEEQIISQVLADSNEVNFITLLGQETGLRDEVVEEKFKQMFKMYVEGQLITAQEVKELIRMRRVSADF